jgi:acyl-CoA synthetase (AMP-forming)/AMP-acid ligase II
VAGGATYYMTSLIDHQDFDPATHLPGLKYAGLGGSPVPAAVTSRLAALGVTVYRAYGSSEHPSVTASLYTAPEAKRLYTDGNACPGVEVKLAGDGEILSRGPDLCLGYTDESLTAAAFDGEGWYHTGDIGVLDEDGYLTVTDRKSDIIIRGGENISAAEVEELLHAMDGVAEAAVVAAPDARLGGARRRVRPAEARRGRARPGRGARSPGRREPRAAEVAGGTARGERVPADRQRQDPEVRAA